MDPQEAAAREAIRDLIARYNHAGDRGRMDALVDCFAGDAVLEVVPEPPLHGSEAIRAFFEGVMREFAAASERVLMRHHVSSTRITLESSDAGAASSYFLVMTEIGLDHWGTYQDEVRREEGRWLFARRKVRVDGYAEGSRFTKRHGGD